MVEIKTNDDLILCCFKAEHQPKDANLNSILYLLRREIKHCFGINPDNGSPNGVYAKWSGTMAIMAGIDLLSKYYFGSRDFTNVSTRFKKFLEDFWELDQNEQEIIWQLRNSLCHSFALYSIDNKNREYKFSLSETGQTLITNTASDNYNIALDPLLAKFYQSINKYQKAVESSDELKTKLVFVLCKIGLIKT